MGANCFVVISNVAPQVEEGRFPIKRIVGATLDVEADVFADEDSVIACDLRYRNSLSGEWREAPMRCLQNDRWSGQFTLHEVGRYLYTLEAWVDEFATWRRYLLHKMERDLDITAQLRIGAELITNASEGAPAAEAKQIGLIANSLRTKKATDLREIIRYISSEDFALSMRTRLKPRLTTYYDKTLQVIVDRKKAQFSSWYELFPRSCGPNSNQHGALHDCERYLGYIAGMGFDVLYLPPIHPIGQRQRIGKNGVPVATDDDPGSPWAIGGEGGGHKSIHPQLGSLDDFRRLVGKAHDLGLEIALDIAFQCSPDHPYVKLHPEWFQKWNDQSISLSDSFPNKYRDIYLFSFAIESFEELWIELKSVLLFWIEQGVRIFRVDNPNTKSLRFWEWVIDEIKQDHPDVLFLAEAFTRPKIMHYLSKIGFTQSLTYFTWRNTKRELAEYFTELAQTELHEYFRPNLWPNTHDILSRYLQAGGKPAFKIRLILAATLGANYGIYGPAFELCENRGKNSESEEYLDSEKYEVKQWNIEDPNSIKGLVTIVNRLRHENPALQSDRNLHFHESDNEYILCYSKCDFEQGNRILVVVNLHPAISISTRVYLHLEQLRLDPNKSFDIYDLLSDASYCWTGRTNYVELSPLLIPAHIFRISQ
jgi:starch synthase (maltosyl-transferring)